MMGMRPRAKHAPMYRPKRPHLRGGASGFLYSRTHIGRSTSQQLQTSVTSNTRQSGMYREGLSETDRAHRLAAVQATRGKVRGRKETARGRMRTRVMYLVKASDRARVSLRNASLRSSRARLGKQAAAPPTTPAVLRSALRDRA